MSVNKTEQLHTSKAEKKILSKSIPQGPKNTKRKFCNLNTLLSKKREIVYQKQFHVFYLTCVVRRHNAQLKYDTPTKIHEIFLRSSS